MLKSWLRLFRVVNLPTVPGDVLAGAASLALAADGYPPAWVVCGAGISILIYMFGLVDNDILGAKTDADRPIPDGEISLRAAKIVRGLLLASAFGLALSAGLPCEWYLAALLLVVSVLAYNRTKSALLMGCCRGLNVGCGAAVVWGAAQEVCLDGRLAPPFVVAALFTLYIAAVTKYSEGEETDPVRRRRVGLLIGAHVYLQLAVLTAFAMMVRTTVPLLVAGAAMLVALRFCKRLFPEVSAS